MNSVFYLSAAVAIVSTVLMITRLNAVHALLYLILSLLSVAVIFFISGAPFAAGLELIIYAGAIMVLFIFVVMLLNLGRRAVESERRLMQGKIWVGSVCSFRSPDCRGGVFDRTRQIVWIAARFRKRRACTGAGRDRSVWALPDWRGTGFHVAAGRPGGSVPPGPARIRESGGSL